MNDAPLYADVADALQRLGFTDEASEFHGVLCGTLCVQRATDVSLPRLSAATDMPRLDGDSRSRQVLEQLRSSALEQLESSGMEFVPLLPDDDQPLSLRVQSLAEWCQGFLYGLASRPDFEVSSCSEEAQEIIGDFSQFTNAGLAAEDDEDLEEDAYAELVEYIRVGAQLVFMELHPRDPGSPALEGSPTLH